jgi:hypothetical protein
MSPDPSRRALLGSVGGFLIAGCLDDDSSGDKNASGPQEPDRSEEGNESDDSEEIPPGCQRSARDKSGIGQASPIERTVEAEETDDRKLECAWRAIDAALDVMGSELGYDLDPSTPWLDPTISMSDYSITIAVRTTITTDHGDGKTEYLNCPPPDFDFDAALTALPREVTMTVEFESEDVECTHEMPLVTRRLHMD